MQIPAGMTENQIVEIIEEVVSKLSPKLVFGFHSLEDIQQEGRMIALHALEKFDASKITVENAGKGLERFLRVHVNRRLRTYRRDNLGRSEKPVNPDRITAWEERNRIRRNIMSPIDIHNLTYDLPVQIDIVEEVHYTHLIDLIKRELPVELRTDFLRMCDGIRISKPRQMKVREAIAEIIKDGVYEEN